MTEGENPTQGKERRLRGGRKTVTVTWRVKLSVIGGRGNQLQNFQLSASGGRLLTRAPLLLFLLLLCDFTAREKYGGNVGQARVITCISSATVKKTVLATNGLVPPAKS